MSKDKNVEKLLKYAQEIIEKEVASKNLMEDLSEKQKLKLRCRISREMKKAGKETPPDNIQIT